MIGTRLSLRLPKRLGPFYLQARGKAVQNWKRPSMDEYLCPHEPWHKVHIRNKIRSSYYLGCGFGFLTFTIGYGCYLDYLPLRNPYKFMYTQQFVDDYRKVDDERKAARAKMEEEEEATEEEAYVRPVRMPVQRSANGIPEEVPYLLIGGGSASFSAFRAIRAQDPRAKILIISEENGNPYMRPPLSKELWYSDKQKASETDLIFRTYSGRERNLYYEKAPFYTDPAYLEFNDKGGIAVLKGHKVVSLDPDSQVASLDDGRKIKYGKCLIATGGKPKSLDVFSGLNGNVVSTFRSVADYLSLEKRLENLKSVAVIGGGFLGTELACALSSKAKKAVQVTQIFPEHGPLARILPEYLSKWALKRIRQEGVRVLSGDTIQSATLTEKGQVLIKTATGQEVVTDHVVVAVGIEPNTDLGQSAGLEVDPQNGGFMVNSELRANHKNIYVAGDVASFLDPQLGRRRLEHHDNAIVTGKLAGENMAGGNKSIANQPMFWTDLGNDIAIEAVGIIDSSLNTVGVYTKVDPKADGNSKNEDYEKGVVFYKDPQDDKVVGVLLWNVFNHMPLARRVVKENRSFDDLSEVAKMFNMYKGPDEEDEPPATPEQLQQKSSEEK